MSKKTLCFVFFSALLFYGCKISGTITHNGAGLEGVLVTLSGSTSLTTTTDSDGKYAFITEELDQGTYLVTPSLEGYAFSPEYREISYSGEALNGIDFEAGLVSFLDRRYDEVAFATTHNAMSNAEEGWLLSNQPYSMTRQLEDGVRALMLDIWYWEGEVILCHACNEWYGYLGGHKPLVEGLAEIKRFLDGNPEEIVTIIFESYVSQGDVEIAFRESGLYDMALAQAPGQPWPTLRDMVDHDTRLVVFTDYDGTPGTWYHPLWSFAWETDYSAEYIEDFSCAGNRGSIGNDLFILNHFLTRGLTAKWILANEVNHNPFFIERVRQCEDESGKFPNFVVVDYYNIGDVMSVVDTLNADGVAAVK